MKIGIRAHDIAANSPEALCQCLNRLQVREIQLVAHKSFPDFRYSEREIQKLKQVFDQYGIHVAVYGCYIDPLTKEGQERFHTHIRYAEILGSGVIATESAVGTTKLQEDERVYHDLVEVFRGFARDGADHGVRVAVETVLAHPICSPEKTRRLLEDVASDNLYGILDPGNLAGEGDDAKERAISQRGIALYGSRISAIHWKKPNLEEAHPALQFAAGQENVPVITEGLTGETLEALIHEMKGYGNGTMGSR